MWEDVDWFGAEQHLLERHDLTIQMADEAVHDPERVVLDPDPKSLSGWGVRIIGYSPTRGRLLTAIVLAEPDGRQRGVTAFPAGASDRRIYEKEERR